MNEGGWLVVRRIQKRTRNWLYTSLAIVIAATTNWSKNIQYLLLARDEANSTEHILSDSIHFRRYGEIIQTLMLKNRYSSSGVEEGERGLGCSNICKEQTTAPWKTSNFYIYLISHVRPNPRAKVPQTLAPVSIRDNPWIWSQRPWQ